MTSLSVDGLVSGLDTAALISQLVTAEGAPQTRLKSRMTATQTAATAYSTVNTAFAALRAAGEALTPTALSSARKASSSDPTVSASATATATVGSSVTFTVKQTASTQSLVTKGSWTSAATPVRDQAEPAWPIEIRNVATGAVVQVDVPDGATLTEAAAAINAANAGLTASVVKTATDEYRLQLTSKTSGSDGAFVIASSSDDPALPGSSFQETTPGQDAVLDLGGAILARSATNTFADLLPGVSITVSKGDRDTPTTISVGNDVDGVTAKVQALVDAVNSALGTVKTHTFNAPGSTAALKGDARLNSLAGQVLSAVASAVGTDGSPAQLGLELTRDGKVSFKKETFTAALAATPELAQRMIAGQPAGAGGEPAVIGVANRLLDLAKKASDSTTGSIVALAKGKEDLARDFQKRIDAWDVRLAARRVTLTRQFTAMETALSGLKQQSSWLAGQISSLPTY